MNWKKINLYLLLSFGISWLSVLILVCANVSYGTTASIFIIGGLYMPGPAIATFIIQKFIYKGDFKNYGWRLEKKKIKWIFYTVLLFLTLLLLTFSVIALFGNSGIFAQFGQLDFSQENFNKKFMELVAEKIDTSKIKLPEISPSVFLLISLLQGIIAGATINLPFMFGEEFGWRGLLLYETRNLGFFQSALFTGLVWGLWHAPIILMGHNYPHHPYFGIIMMCLMTIAISPVFAYVRVKMKSILSACMLHGMVNATAALFTLYVINSNELFTGLAGLSGVIAGIIIAIGIYLFDKHFVKNYSALVEINSLKPDITESPEQKPITSES